VNGFSKVSLRLIGMVKMIRLGEQFAGDGEVASESDS